MPLTRDNLRRYLVEEQGIAPEELDGETRLFTDGLLDSFTMVELIHFIEESAGFEMDEADVHLEHLDTVERILAFVESQTAEKPV